MTLTVSVIPASSSAGREAVRHLLKDDVTVRGFYRDTSKAPDDFTQSPLFTTVQGNVQDPTSLNFEGSDVVFYVPPPVYDGTDLGEFATHAANNVKSALQKASVRRLVLLSAPGSQHSSGIGILKINHISEVILKQSVPEIFIVRPFYFYEDWASQISTLKQDPPTITSVFSPLDYKIPMISVVEVGLHAARSATGPAPASSPHIFKLYGPRAYSSLDVRDAIARAMNRDVAIREITPDKLREHTAALVPAAIVDDVMGITTATLPGGVLQDEYEPTEGIDVVGKLTLEDVFMKIFGELKG